MWSDFWLLDTNWIQDNILIIFQNMLGIRYFGKLRCTHRNGLSDSTEGEIQDQLNAYRLPKLDSTEMSEPVATKCFKL
jgi:hypothetical protein